WIEVLPARGQSGVALIVALVPTHRIENEPAVLRETILQGLAGDDVRWDPCQELRGQGIERVRVTAGRQPMSLQRAADDSKIQLGLGAGEALGASRYGGQRWVRREMF